MNGKLKGANYFEKVVTNTDNTATVCLDRRRRKRQVKSVTWHAHARTHTHTM